MAPPGWADELHQSPGCALAELRDELIEQSQSGFRQPTGEKTAAKKDQLVNPKIRNKKNPVNVLREELEHFAPRSRVDYKPAINPAGAQQAKVVHGKDSLTAEACRSVLSDNTDSHISSHAGRKIW